MYAFLIVLAIIACLLLIVVILVQNPKGGGLSSTFGGSNQVMGVQRTGDFLEKATWAFAITLLAISLSTKFFIGGGASVGESAIQEQIDRQAAPAPTSPLFPGTTTGGDETPASGQDRKSTRLNSSHQCAKRMPSSA